MRVTPQQAATELGISVEAVRQRIRRGSLRSEKDEDGSVWVDLDESIHHTDRDQTSGQTLLVERLDSEIQYLRQELERAHERDRETRRLLAAALERIPPQLEPPAEPPQTVEEEPERATPQQAEAEAQEATEPLQRRSRWLAPVDKLPWWHYVLGIIAVFLATFLTLAAALTAAEPPTLLFYAIVFAGPWTGPGVFGFWVGFRQRITRFWSQIIPFGALVGAVAALGFIAYAVVVQHRSVPLDLFATVLGGLYALPAWLLFVSGSLSGNAWQRRRTGRISGTTPASPVSRATQGAAQQPRKDLTPAQQAMLGWGGAIISALITLFGTIIAVRGGS